MSIAPLPFVGRTHELGVLDDFLTQVYASNGGTMVVEGPLGIGKSTLIKQFARAVEAQRKPDLLIANCSCSSYSSILNPSVPFAELLASVRDGEQSNARRIAWRTIKETAPDWLATIPVFGPFVSAGAKTVRAIATKPAVGSQSATMAETLISQYAGVLQALIDRGLALLLVVEDAQWLAYPGYQLLAVMTEAASGRAGVVVTYDRRQLESDRPLEAELSRIQVRQGGERLPLGPLSRDELARALCLHFGSELHALFPDWLEHYCGGNPLLVEHYLDFLKRRGQISQDLPSELSESLVRATESLARGQSPPATEVPPALDQMIRLRFGKLPEEQLELLRVGATHGIRFSAELVSMANGQAADRGLRRVERETGLVARLEAEDRLFPDSEVYGFENGITQRAIYAEMSPRERRRRHLAVAAALAKVTPPIAGDLQRLLSQIGWHRLAAGEKGEGARAFLEAGEVAFGAGNLLDAIELSGRAYLHSIEDPSLRAASGLLVLKSTEPWWGAPTVAEETIWSLLDVTLDAAAESGDLALNAQAHLATARYFRERGDQDSARVLMRQAVSLAELSGDYTVRLAALSDLGYAVSPVDLGEGLQILRLAERLYQERFGRSGQAEQQRRYALLQAYIGVGEFDAGRFGEAGRRLAVAIASMEELEMKADLPRVLGFRGQLQMATGAFDEAEETFRRGIDLLSASGPGAGLSAYNQALCGKLFLERGDLGKARAELDAASRIVAQLPHVDLELSVRLYSAELLIRERSFDHARAECDWVIGVALSARYPGFLAMAHSFAAAAHLGNGALEPALSASTAAVQDLNVSLGPVLARPEEVLLRHVQVLRAARPRTPVEVYVRRAHQVVSAKAASLEDQEAAGRFLSLPQSAAVLQEVRSLE